MMRTVRTVVIVIGLLYAHLLNAQTGDQEKLGLPGDNLNLYAVMKLFQESPTLEEFEKKLNAEDGKINNLDLDGDEQTDYISVTDEVEGRVHNIVLRVAVSSTESQDIAVFTVDRNEDGGVEIQLTGDEELYGKDYIIEPNTNESGSTPNPGYTGKTPTTRDLDDKQIVVNTFLVEEIRTWPMVTYLYMPTYIRWYSPYYYGYYPGWWRPWRPWYWDQYYGFHYNYYNYYWGWYRRWPSHRRPYWNDYYYRNRRYSPAVYNRRQSGYYSTTYSRPDLRKDGLAQYQKINPTRPVLKPGLNKPAPRPTRPSISRPNTGATRPAPTKPAPTRPLPASPGTIRPVYKPTQPTIKPNPKPGQPATRPAPKPTQPSTRPAKSQPSTRPAPKPLQPAPRPAPKPAPRPAPTHDKPQKA